MLRVSKYSLDGSIELKFYIKSFFITYRRVKEISGNFSLVKHFGL